MKYVQLSLFDNDMRSVSDKELIANLTKKEDVVADIMECSYDMEVLFNSLTPQRRKIAVSAVELYKRTTVKRKNAAAIRCSNDIFEIMRPLVADLMNEEFWLIMLSQSAKLIKKVRVSVGGIDQTCADVRLIMRLLIEAGAVQFAVVHNHPSGNTRPSNEDRLITDKLNNAAKLFNIRLTDHIIVAGSKYYSFMDEGMI